RYRKSETHSTIACFRRQQHPVSWSDQSQNRSVGVAMSFDLSGRVAVVVGGTSGIGRALALGLADAGADVVVTGRRVAMINEVAAEIKGRGRRTLRVPTDVTNPAALRALNAACLEEFG